MEEVQEGTERVRVAIFENTCRMPVRSLTDRVMKWPDAETIRAAAHFARKTSWGRSLFKQELTLFERRLDLQ